MRPDNPIRNLDLRNWRIMKKRIMLPIMRRSVETDPCVGRHGERGIRAFRSRRSMALILSLEEIALPHSPTTTFPCRSVCETLLSIHQERSQGRLTLSAQKLEVAGERSPPLFGNAENQELVEALACLYEEIYGAPSEKFKAAAYHRAMGMLYSGLNEGKPANSPLLVKEEEALYHGCQR